MYWPNGDSKYATFKVSVIDAEAKTARKTMKLTYDKLIVVSLPTNDKTTFEKVKSFSFSGDFHDWIAIQFASLETTPKDKDAAKRTNILLYHLSDRGGFY